MFALNAVLSLGAGFLLMTWRHKHTVSPLGRERLASAMRVGVQFVRESTRLQVLLVRIILFFIHATAIMALLPLVARALKGGNAGTFTLLLASMGTGAIISALSMGHVRRRLPPERLVLVGTAVQSLATLIVGWAPNIYVAVPGMVLAGMSWIAVANSLTVQAQMALPDWVRARGMSIYQMGIMGSTAAGAALWGQVATVGSIHISLGIAACTGILSMAAVSRFMPLNKLEEDLTPSRAMKAPSAKVHTVPAQGRIQVNIEYRIDPARADEFRALMQESRRSRMRQGALQWELLHDMYDPGRFVEQITDESWTEHLRRFDRVTADDVRLRDAKMAFHVGSSPPVVTRCVIEAS